MMEMCGGLKDFMIERYACIFVSICVYTCMYACFNVCTCVCMQVCLCICMHVCEEQDRNDMKLGVIYARVILKAILSPNANKRALSSCRTS